MFVSHRTEFRGRKQRVGTIMFSETGRLQYFLGYCPSCNGKCSVSPEEARLLLRRFGSTNRKLSQRLTQHFLGKYANE